MAGAWKDFERIIIAVQEEFDSAVIRLHIPVADFVEMDVEEKARALQRLMIKPAIRLIISHNFMSQEELLDFLAQTRLALQPHLLPDAHGVAHCLGGRCPIPEGLHGTSATMG